ncbi:MAG: CehA/McbA family metallohydrolase [Candidatus Hydrogenedentota bacterium]|nr:MAG: CehA/McbA family metallohydrolase [Candidatus Hydrogenedentota bacterium]
MRPLRTKLLPHILAVLLPAVLGPYFPGTAMAEVLAERITTSNAEKYLPKCPDRCGGIGDWYLANDVIWAIIDDVSNSNFISSSGGTLLDLGPVGHACEQFVQMMPLLNMTRDLVVPYDHIRVEKGDDWASLVVSSTHGLRPERPGFGVLSREVAEKIIAETEYRLTAGENFLRIKTTISNDGAKRARIFAVADLIYWGDDVIKPFGGSQERLGAARGTPRGFQHPLFEPESVLSIVQAIGGFTYVAGGGVEALSPVSYGLCSPTEYEKNRLLWGVNDRMVSVIGPFTGKFNRPYDLWRIFFFGIPPGEQFVYERVMVVGNHNDVASATDTIFRLLGKTDAGTGVVGKVEPTDADTSMTIFTEDGGLPVTQIRPARAGKRAGLIRALLPPGKYMAEIRSTERDPDLATPQREPIAKRFSVEKNGFTDIGTVELPESSTLLVEVLEGGRPSPARVIIRGSSDTPDPELGSDLLGFTLADIPMPSSYSANWLLLDGNEDAPVRVGLRPGRYTVHATHGFEYSIARAEVDLSLPGAEVSVRLSLEKVIDTPGMMSGDFHVHSEAGADSAFSQEQRVASFVAEGVDLLVATDHDTLTEYMPVISRLNLLHRLTSMVGVEATSTQKTRATPFTIGHYNSWPLRYEPTLPRRGMIPDEGIRPRDLFDRLRQIADGESIIQVNHGRAGRIGAEASYFNALGLDFGNPLAYDPTRPLTDSPNNLLLVENSNGIRDIDFDAMELLNGSYYEAYLMLRADWFSLLNQGYIKTGTANSDTHVKGDLAGYPRNYIILRDPQAERADNRILVEQIRRQKVFGTTGPIIEFNINGEATLGDTVTVKDGNVTLNIKVLAAHWIPLDEVRIFANGHRVGLFKTGAQSDVVRFERSIPLTLEKDTWFVVETASSGSAKSQIPEPPGGLYNVIAPEFVPIAFTNPIFVDVDGNGRYDPPGISPTITISEPPRKVKAYIVATFLATVFVIGYLRRRRARF